jgi:GT2 family glycosyltransferase
MLPNISIIIVNFNGLPHLLNCINSIKQINYPRDRIEVILVDNASKDGSALLAKVKFPWIKLLRLPKNYGYAEGCNRGAKISNGDYLVFLNNDTAVDGEWLINLVKVIERDDSIGICGSKILFLDRPNIVNHAGGKISLIGSGYDIGFGEQNINDELPLLVGYVSGASMMIRKKAFIKLRGFDLDYFMYCEDVDLCWRAWLNGYKVVYIPSSIVYHKFRGSFTRGLVKIEEYYWHRNSLLNLIKNFQFKNMLIGITLYYLFYTIKLFKFLLNGDLSRIKGMLKVNIWLVRNVKKLHLKRILIQKNRKIKDRELQEIGAFTSFMEAVKEFGKNLTITLTNRV